MAITELPRQDVGYYALLRYVPDPLREESINVGMFLVSEDGNWSRFDATPPRGVLRSLKRGRDVDRIEEWARRFKQEYHASGELPLLPTGTVDPQLLSTWSEEWGGMLRISPPKVALGEMETLWSRLYSRLVSGRPAPQPRDVALATVDESSHTALYERTRILRRLREDIAGWANLDPQVVQYDVSLQGRQATHHADVVFQNGRPKAVAQVIPIRWGTEYEVIVARALITEAAADLDREVLKVAIHEAPLPDRKNLLSETSAYFGELPPELRVELLPLDAFHALEGRISPLLALHE